MAVPREKEECPNARRKVRRMTTDKWTNAGVQEA